MKFEHGDKVWFVDNKWQAPKEACWRLGVYIRATKDGQHVVTEFMNEQGVIGHQLVRSDEQISRTIPDTHVAETPRLAYPKR